MIATRSAPKSREGAFLWLFKIVSGVLILVVLIIHLIVNHFLGENALLTYADVINYFSNPIIPVMELFFLTFVVTHSLVGLRGVILDLKPSDGVLKVVDVVLVLGGVTAIVYGFWLMFAILRNGGLI